VIQISSPLRITLYNYSRFAHDSKIVQSKRIILPGSLLRQLKRPAVVNTAPLATTVNTGQNTPGASITLPGGLDYCSRLVRLDRLTAHNSGWYQEEKHCHPKESSHSTSPISPC
jgi:hypothetical protein